MKHNLNHLRNEITDIDTKVLELLKRRFEVVQKIAELKKEAGVEIDDAERERELFEMYEKLAVELNLDLKFVKKIFEEIILESKKIQEK
jgi:chorismate mutase